MIIFLFKKVKILQNIQKIIGLPLNFNSNLRYIFKNDIISSVILNNTFYYYNANKDLIAKTNKIKSQLENINIIWGFKLNNFNSNFSRRWEYYVYAWNPIDDKNIYEKNKKYRSIF